MISGGVKKKYGLKELHVRQLADRCGLSGNRRWGSENLARAQLFDGCSRGPTFKARLIIQPILALVLQEKHIHKQRDRNDPGDISGESFHLALTQACLVQEGRSAAEQ